MPKKPSSGIPIFQNPLAQKALQHLKKQIKAGNLNMGARDLLFTIMDKMHDDRALLKLIKDFGGKPTPVNIIKTGIKTISKNKKKKPNLKVVKKYGGVIGSGVALRGFGSTRKSNKGVK